MENIVEAEKINHYYQEGRYKKQVLFDIDLIVKPEEIVILTGESGSGKTTLLSLVGCTRSVQEGSLKICGQELNRVWEKKQMKLRRKIGYIFQQFNLLDFMSVRQNVQIPLEIKSDFNPKKARQQTEAILEEVGLGNRLDYYPGELSGGQKQRVAIARALVHQPQLVLADEPTAALDRKTGREVVEVIKNLAKKQGSAVLIVTHDSRILDVGDRILRMEDGRLRIGYEETISIALPTLTELQLTEMLPKLELLFYPPSSIIIREGDLAEKFYIIIEGFVEVVQERSDSEPVFLTKLGRNDYFGEIGLMQQSRRTATVRVPPDSQAQLIAIDRETFSKMVSDSDVTYAAISHRLCQRLINDLNRS